MAGISHNNIFPSISLQNKAISLALIRASGIGLAAPVLAGLVFLKVRIKFHFYKKYMENKCATMILGLIRLITLSYDR